MAALVKQVRQDQDGWILETSRIRVVSEVDAQFTAEATRYMELFFDAMGRTAGIGQRLAKGVKGKPILKIYATEKRFQENTRSDGRGLFVARRWSDKTITDTILHTYIDTPEQRSFNRFPIPVLQHEGTHLLVCRTFGASPVPDWFDEGLATVFESWDLRQKVAPNLKDRFARSQYAGLVQNQLLENKLLSLRAWFADMRQRGFHPPGDQEAGARNYALSEALMDYLVRTPGGQEIFRFLTSRFLAGVEEDRLLDPSTIEALDRSFRAYLKVELLDKKGFSGSGGDRP